MSPRPIKRWSFTTGDRGATVRVFEREPGGVLYAKVWDPTLGYQVKQSLGHRDREAAKRYAGVEAQKLREGTMGLTAAPTIGFVLTQYLLNRTPKKVPAVQTEDRRRAGMWRVVLGPETPIAHLGRAEWERFIAVRGTGAIDPHGRHVPDGVDPKTTKPRRRQTGARAVDADLVFMVAVLNWATSWSVAGRPLLDRNPWGAQSPGVKRALARPTSDTVRQPVATFDRFLTVRAAAKHVHMVVRRGDAGAKLVTVGRAEYRRGPGPVKQWMKPSYLPELLDLVEDTGRRISSICRLEYSDIVREHGKVAQLRWRPLKGSLTKVVPLGKRARAAIERIVRIRPGIGDRPLFPSPKKPAKSMSRWLARDWLARAEDLAGVAHIDGGAFHPYRRKWATERKAHPTADVMAVGDWRDERSLKASYQKVDVETVLEVVNEPRKLRARA